MRAGQAPLQKSQRGQAGAPLDSQLRLERNDEHVEDWSRYADEPEGLLNTREVPREERRRQWWVGGVRFDAKLTAPRRFEPLCQEKEKKKSRFSFRDCLGLALLRIVAHRAWDRVYLFAFGIFLFLLPAGLENDFGLRCQDQTRPCLVLWPPLALMAISTLPPIVGAFLFRVFGWSFLMQRFGPDKRRFWSLFFVLGLKALTRNPLSALVTFFWRQRPKKSSSSNRTPCLFFFRTKVMPLEDDGCLRKPPADNDDENENDDSDYSDDDDEPSELSEEDTRTQVEIKDVQHRRSTLLGLVAAKLQMRKASAHNGHNRSAKKASIFGGLLEMTTTTTTSGRPSFTGRLRLSLGNVPSFMARRLSSASTASLASSTKSTNNKQRRKSRARAHLRAIQNGDRELEWKCITCGRDNSAPLAAKEETVETIIHRTKHEYKPGEERISASFKLMQYRPRCSVCETPIDYHARKSNASHFHPASGDAVRAVTLITAQRQDQEAAAKEAKRQARIARKLVIKKRRLLLHGPDLEHGSSSDDENNDSVLKSHAAMVSSVIEESRQQYQDEELDREQETHQFVRDMFERQRAKRKAWTIHNLLYWLHDSKWLRYIYRQKKAHKKNSAKHSDKMIFHDYTFERRIQKFKPQPPRRVLKKGERYAPGDLVESYAHFPTWYPATVQKANANGSYVLQFDNGEYAEAVAQKCIRYRISHPISALHQTFAASTLLLLTLAPAWFGLYFAGSRPSAKSKHKALALPVLCYAILIYTATVAQLVSIFFRHSHGARCCFLTKIFLFFSSVPGLFLLFALMLYVQSGPLVQASADGYGILLVLIVFGILATIVASMIKPIYFYLGLAAAPPIFIFTTLYLLWTNGLAILHGRLVFLQGRLYIVFLPAYFSYAQLWWLHRNLPLLWDATFYSPSVRPNSNDGLNDDASIHGDRAVAHLEEDDDETALASGIQV